MGEKTDSKFSRYHAVLFPFMSKGHTIPLLHLAHLLLCRRLNITIFTTPANHPFIAKFLSNTSASIIVLRFPEHVPEIPPGVESTDKLPSMALFPAFSLATEQMQPEFETVLKTLSPVNFIISDFFLWWTADSAIKFSIPRLIFSGMSNYSASVSRAVVEDKLLFKPEDDDELVTVTQFPWIKVARNDFDSTFRNPNPEDPHFNFIIKTVITASKSYGYITNSFYELESYFVDYWNSRDKQKSWCVGPLCLANKEEQRTEKNYKKPSWIQWLDQKLNEGNSVLYAAFGSQAEISAEQLKEIAKGLEESEVNFLWVIRKQETELGDRFEERVKGRGIIVREWVDQMEILKHKSVKGFLSHCGWNSVLEGICAGVPILAWPMMAEQPLNAKMVAEEIKIGLKVETINGSVRGFVKKEGLSKSVKELMGENVYAEKVMELSKLARKAMEEGTGSSWCTLEKLIEELCICGKEEDVSCFV